MSLFARILHTIKGTANDVLDTHQNLGAEARQTVRELTEELNKAENVLIDVRAENELMKAKRDTYKDEVAKWLNAATNAAGKDDALARECLAKKATASTKLAAVDVELEKFQPTLAAIEKQIADRRNQIESMSSQADVISAQSSVADVQLRAAELLGAGNNGAGSMSGAQDALDRKVARANAAVSIVTERSGDSLEARVAALNAGPSIEDELAALNAGK